MMLLPSSESFDSVTFEQLQDDVIELAHWTINDFSFFDVKQPRRALSNRNPRYSDLYSIYEDQNENEYNDDDDDTFNNNKENDLLPNDDRSIKSSIFGVQEILKQAFFREEDEEEDYVSIPDARTFKRSGSSFKAFGSSNHQARVIKGLGHAKKTHLPPTRSKSDEHHSQVLIVNRNDRRITKSKSQQFGDSRAGGSNDCLVGLTFTSSTSGEACDISAMSGNESLQMRSRRLPFWKRNKKN